MATHLKILILTCLLSPMVLMEEMNPVMLEQRARGRLGQRTSRLEERMEEQEKRTGMLEETIRMQEETIRMQEEMIRALEECKRKYTKSHTCILLGVRKGDGGTPSLEFAV